MRFAVSLEEQFADGQSFGAALLIAGASTAGGLVGGAAGTAACVATTGGTAGVDIVTCPLLIDIPKTLLGYESGRNDEGINGNVGPFQTGPVTYLPGWHSDDPSHVDLSWTHPYPISTGFGPISPGSRP